MLKVFLALGLGLIGSLPTHRDTESSAGESATAQLRREAGALEPLVASGLARAFLKATPDLPAIAPRNSSSTRQRRLT